MCRRERQRRKTEYSQSKDHTDQQTEEKKTDHNEYSTVLDKNKKKQITTYSELFKLRDYLSIFLMNLYSMTKEMNYQ